MDKMTLQHGVTLEPQLQDDLISIMKEMSDEVRTPIRENVHWIKGEVGGWVPAFQASINR